MEEILSAIKGGVYALFLYLGMNTDIVKALFILMAIDSFLGVVKALRLGEKFSFKKLLWGIVTKLSILIIPMVVALVAKGLSFDFKYFVIAVMDIIAASEGISCITNIISIKSKKKIENADYISMLLNAIKKGLTAIVQRALKALEDGKI